MLVLLPYYPQTQGIPTESVAQTHLVPPNANFIELRNTYGVAVAAVVDSATAEDHGALEAFGSCDFALIYRIKVQPEGRQGINRRDNRFTCAHARCKHVCDPAYAYFDFFARFTKAYKQFTVVNVARAILPA